MLWMCPCVPWIRSAFYQLHLVYEDMANAVLVNTLRALYCVYGATLEGHTDFLPRTCTEYVCLLFHILATTDYSSNSSVCCF